MWIIHQCLGYKGCGAESTLLCVLAPDTPAHLAELVIQTESKWPTAASPQHFQGSVREGLTTSGCMKLTFFLLLLFLFLVIGKVVSVRK